MKKKQLALLLFVLGLLFFLLPTTASATTTSGEWEYSISDSCAVITAYCGSSSYVTVPSTLDGWTVVRIDNCAFEDNENLISVTLPNTLESIGNGAFSDCTKLESITFPEKLKTVNRDAFSNCRSLSKITVHSRNLSEFNSYGTFFNAGQDAANGITVEFTGTATRIPANMFCDNGSGKYAKIKTVKISTSVEEIGYNAFKNCYDLETVTIASGSVLETIGDDAFYNCTSLTSIDLPEKLKTVDEGAFGNCKNLSSIVLPIDLKTVNRDAFSNCRSLSKITVHSRNLSEFNSYGTFFNAGQDAANGITVEFTGTATRIPANMFCDNGSGKYAKIKTVKISTSVEEIGYNAFKNCYDLETVTIAPGSALETIGDDAFYNCTSLTSIDLPEKLKTVDEGAFGNCKNLSSIVLPIDLKTVNRDAFSNCRSLSKITVHSRNLSDFNSYGTFFNAGQDAANGITVEFTGTAARIPANMFSDNGSGKYAKIKTVKISSSVQSIGRYAFDACYDLQTVIFQGNAPEIDNYAFYNDTLTAYYPSNNSTWTSSVRSDYSGNVTWVAYTPLSITKQPVSVTVAKGKTASVYVNVAGKGLSFKWYYKNAGDTQFYRTTSFTKNTYSVTMDASRNGRQVYCVISDQYGNSVKTNTVTLKMATLTITKQSTDVTVPKGKTATAYVNVAGEGLSFKWYYKNAGDSKFYLTSSFKSNIYSVTMDASRNGRQVYCVISDKYGNTVKSNTVTLKMATPLAITKQPTSVTVAKGATASTTVTATGDNLRYTWYLMDVGAKTWSKSSITSKTYAFAMTAAKSGRHVYCVITDGYGNKVTTKSVTLNMKSGVTITTQPVSTTVANGQTATVKVAASGSGLTYKWYFKNPGDSNFYLTNSFKSNTYSVTMDASRSGRQVYCVISDRNGNTVATQIVSLKMK